MPRGVTTLERCDECEKKPVTTPPCSKCNTEYPAIVLVMRGSWTVVAKVMDRGKKRGTTIWYKVVCTDSTCLEDFAGKPPFVWVNRASFIVYVNWLKMRGAWKKRRPLSHCEWFDEAEQRVYPTVTEEEL